MNDLRVPEKVFRPEIEGVRAVAALLVAIYHIWFGKVSGGVDVFFVVSGFLITTSLLSRIEKHGQIRFFDYLIGLARRLFPISLIVIITSIIFSYLLLPQIQWKQIISEAFASIFYFQNWELANNAVDYLAKNNEASPFQHYWALSIQGQFYILWPLIILLSYIVAKKVLNKPFRKTFLMILIIIFSISITYSVFKTNVNQPWAYFDTFARMWEFSLGGLLALLISYININKFISVITGWIGLLIICLTGVILPVSTVFPGYVALLPAAGVILIIVSAVNNSNINAKRLLGSRPFKFFGSISYAFYLWHWPLLIFYFAFFGNESVSLLHGLFILLIAFILSVLSTKMIETPIRHSLLYIRKIPLKNSRPKLLTILSISLFFVVSINFAWADHLNNVEENQKLNFNIEDYPGAKVLYESILPAPGVEPITTSPDATSHLPTFYTDGCYVRMGDEGIKVCSYGEIVNPKYTIALVGGSHSGHWFPALEQFAEELDIQIEVYNKDACRFTTQVKQTKYADSCEQWNKLAIEKLKENPPDIIFTTAKIRRNILHIRHS